MGALLGLVVVGCCVLLPALAGVVALFGFRRGDKDGKPDRNIQEVTGHAQDAKKTGVRMGRAGGWREGSQS